MSYMITNYVNVVVSEVILRVQVKGHGANAKSSDLHRGQSLS
jgi:hypothetical protein